MANCSDNSHKYTTSHRTNKYTSMLVNTMYFRALQTLATLNIINCNLSDVSMYVYVPIYTIYIQ